MKLCNVKSVRRGESYQLSEKDKNEAKSKLHEGAEWFGNEINKIVVKLTDKGIKDYNSYYLNKPKYINFDKVKKEMTFLCSEQQIFNYFISFGRHVKIINNDGLKEKFYKHHRNAYEEYNK